MDSTNGNNRKDVKIAFESLIILACVYSNYYYALNWMLFIYELTNPLNRVQSFESETSSVSVLQIRLSHVSVTDSIFNIYYYLIYIICMFLPACLCTMRMQYLRGPEEDARSMELGLRTAMEPSRGCWEPNWDSL